MVVYKNSCYDEQVKVIDSTRSSHLTESKDFAKNIIIPTNNDVLNGRGKSIYAWQGNIFYRELIQYFKLEYIFAPPDEQKLIAQRVVDRIRGLYPPGRFLEMNKNSGTWCDIGDEKAIFKIRQALREGAPELREQITPNAIGLPSNDEMSERECKQFLEMVS